MLQDERVRDHYSHGDLLNAIKIALEQLGKTTETVSIEELSAVDEFHIGGRLATDHLVDQLDLFSQCQVLDLGCGLGGAARYVAHQYHSYVTGVDLTPEYIETGLALTGWVKLEELVTLVQASVLSMPFESDYFDAAYTLHVGMNIEDKATFFTEVFRVLKPGAFFGIYDVMRQNEGNLTYPMPLASEPESSKLASALQYHQVLSSVGFDVLRQNNRRDFALAFFSQLREKAQQKNEPPQLSLYTLIRKNASAKFKNMIDGIVDNLIVPIELVARKPF